MLPEQSARLIWLGVLVLMIGVLGLGMIIALLASWRNHTRRDRLLKKGREFRAAQHPDPPPAVDDAWHEAGRRYREPDDHADGDINPGHLTDDMDDNEGQRDDDRR